MQFATGALYAIECASVRSDGHVNRGQGAIYLGRNQSSNCDYGYIKFALSELLQDVPSNATIVSAILNLRPVDNYSDSNFGYRVFACKADWSASTITWANRPSDETVGDAVSLAGKTWHSWNITNIAQHWLTDPDYDYSFGLFIRPNSTNQYSYKKLNGPTASLYVPHVSIVYDVPASVPTLDKSLYVLGDTVTVNLDVVEETATHTVHYYIGDSTTPTATQELAAGVSSTTWLVPTSIGAQFQNTQTTALRVAVTTAVGGETRGTLEVNATLGLPSDAAPTASCAATRTGQTQVEAYVQKQSGVTLTVAAAGKYGATIASYAVTLEGVTQTTATAAFAAISGSGDVTYRYTVTDSRGLTTTGTGILVVLPWDVPQIGKFAIQRVTELNVPDIGGTYGRATVQAAVSVFSMPAPVVTVVSDRDVEFHYSGSGSYSFGYIEDLPEPITAGTEYTITWDGVEYVRTATAQKNSDVCLGNLRPYYGGSEYDTGEPFLIIYDPVYLITIMAISTDATHRVQITRAGTQTTNNTLSYQVHYRQIGSVGDWTATDAVSASGQSVSDAALLKSGGAAIDSFGDLLGYEFRLTVTDRFGASTAFAEMPTKDVMLHIRRSAKSVAIGMESTGTAGHPMFEVAPDARFYGDVQFDGSVSGLPATTIAYTTVEVDTGDKWVNGKPIYSKILDLTGSWPSGADPNFLLSIEEFDLPVEMTGVVRVNSRWANVNFAFSTSVLVSIYVIDGRIYLTNTSNYAIDRIIIHLRYTKSTDTATRYVLPCLTADSSQGCVASASTVINANFPAWQAFNANADTHWASSASDTNRWIQIQMPHRLKDMVVMLTNNSYATDSVVSGKFLGSNDGSSWAEIGSFSGRPTTVFICTKHVLHNTTGYSYLRIAVTEQASATNASGIADIRIEGEIVSG